MELPESASHLNGKLKVLSFGAGAIGTYIGGSLALAGHPVVFVEQPAVVEELRQRGLRVPDDVSVVGFDDLPEARWSSPPLTTVRQPLADMGRLAVRTVQRLVLNETIESSRVELATELIVRHSTAPPPAS